MPFAGRPSTRRDRRERTRHSANRSGRQVQVMERYSKQRQPGEGVPSPMIVGFTSDSRRLVTRAIDPFYGPLPDDGQKDELTVWDLTGPLSTILVRRRDSSHNGSHYWKSLNYALTPDGRRLIRPGAWSRMAHNATPGVRNSQTSRAASIREKAGRQTALAGWTAAGTRPPRYHTSPCGTGPNSLQTPSDRKAHFSSGGDPVGFFASSDEVRSYLGPGARGQPSHCGPAPPGTNHFNESPGDPEP